MRFTFPANTTLAAGRAVIIFGGGTPPIDDPAFGAAMVMKASSLGLNDTGDTVEVELMVAGVEVAIARLIYGAEGTPPAAASNQSLTRSPDAEVGATGGEHIAHSTAAPAEGRLFSPGTRLDGTPFGSPPITRVRVLPPAATIDAGGTQGFTARAFSNASGSEVEVENVSFTWDVSDPSKATVSPVTGATTTARGIRGGNTAIRARAGGQQNAASLRINFPPVSRIEVTPPFSGAPVGGTLQFTARAFDANNNEI